MPTKKKRREVTEIIEDQTREDHRESFSFRAFPEQLACVRNGDPEGLKATFTPDFRAYYGEAIPDHAQLPLIFSHLCGCLHMLSYESGLPLSRAAAISSKYMNKAAAISSIEKFVDELQRMQMEYASQVALARRFSSGNAAVDLCMNHIHEHVNEKISLAELAAVSGYSLSRLEHVFHACTGMTLTDYIRRQKINRACILLRYTEDSCAAISQKLSYCSQSYFIRQFQRETGMTPALYRRQGR